MLEDFIVGVQYLSEVEFKFVEGQSGQDDYLTAPPHVTGTRYGNSNTVRLYNAKPRGSHRKSLLDPFCGTGKEYSTKNSSKKTRKASGNGNRFSPKRPMRLERPNRYNVPN